MESSGRSGAITAPTKVVILETLQTLFQKINDLLSHLLKYKKHNKQGAQSIGGFRMVGINAHAHFDQIYRNQNIAPHSAYCGLRVGIVSPTTGPQDFLK